MFLEIRDIKQNSFKIGVKRSDTMMQVKEKIKLKIEVIDIDDQKLVYSGNILTDDVTVDELKIDKNDYITLIYRSTKKDEVCEIIQSLSSQNSSNYTESFDAESHNTSEELISSAEQIIDADDSDCDDLTHYALLETIPDLQNLCRVIGNNPLELPKILSKLSHQGPLVFEKILEHPDAFIDLLNNVDELCSNESIEKLEMKDYEAIDRLVTKGYEKDLALQVYQACHFNEIDAAQLLSYLHWKWLMIWCLVELVPIDWLTDCLFVLIDKIVL